ncbi:MAG: thiamine pyrophosphate-dependent enzyme [Candidatus Daviesbacteria bacterium]|nr:thiamine pyrophosphate-dependent enzyme [Candidatus Daviesbacteria bacterium]
MKIINKSNKILIKRIIDISFKHKLSHIGSCLSILEILDTIYHLRGKSDPVILSNGHAGVALYVILEKYENKNAEDLYLKHGVHPNRDLSNGIYASTGSLGQGLPIAVGMAIADKSKDVYCITSDGECTEGSIWESIRIASEQKLNNLKVVVSINGYGAYDKIDVKLLPRRFKAFGCKITEINGHNQEKLRRALRSKSQTKPLVVLASTRVDRLSFLRGLDAHYKIMTEPEYSLALKELE